MKLPTLAQAVTASRYAYFGDSGGVRSGLRVFLAGRESCLAGYRVRRMSFSGYGVEYVSEGAGRVVLDGKSFPLFPGVLFCYGPRTVHDIATDPDCSMTKYFADFSGSDALRTLRANHLSPGAAVQILDLESTGYFFEQMIAQRDVQDAFSAENAAHCLALILLRAQQALPPTRPSPTAADFSRWREYIDQNYLTLRSLQQLAKELKTRPSRICRVFQQCGHPGPFQYLTQKKLHRAVELLVGEQRSVQSAALAVGYEDPYHFSRLFKQNYGHSPVKFLKLTGRFRRGER